MTIEIENRHLDYYCGQHDMALIATVAGVHAGTLRYVVYDGEPSVSMIKVRKSMRRQGIGTAMVVALQREFSGIPIQFGGLTGHGASLLNSLEWDVVTNEDHAVAASQLRRVEARLRDYAVKAERIVGAGRAEKDAFIREVSDWNDLHDEADRLREIVSRNPSSFRFVVERIPSDAPAAKLSM
ncbi:hypothetical protein HFN89_00675 [Rhizobium laguerreae]|nr:hypothetical protein [Rhizobium laguerreae]